MKKAKNKILIAQLGAGGYQLTTYVDEEKTINANTGYVFDAIIEKEQPNKVLFVGTGGSGWGELASYYAQKLTDEKLKTIFDKRWPEIKSEDRKNPILSKEDSKLWKDLQDIINGALKIENVRIAIVPNGKDKEELVDYFEVLKDNFEYIAELEKYDETEVLFDVSNGFRSMPLYIMMLIKYFGLVNKKELKYKTYYGMYEIARDNDGIAPLVNLTTVSEMTDWINAISEFRNFGSVKALYKCLTKEINDTNREEVNKIINIFEEFDYAVNSNNLSCLKEQITNIGTADFGNINISSQAKLMLANIQEDLEQRFTLNDSHKDIEKSFLLIKLAQMYNEQGRYGSAAVALQEGVITYLIERYLKEDIIKAKGLVELSDEYINEYKKRRPIEEMYNNSIDRISKNKTKSGKNGKYFEDRYPFEHQFLVIKSEIRNVNAHISEKEPNQKIIKNSYNILKASIDAILWDMGLLETDDVLKPKFEAVKENFSENELKCLKEL